MDKEKFKSLMQEAGIKKKQELAGLLDLTYGSVNAWGSIKPYPKYLKSWFENYIKAKKYDEALKNGVSESLQNDESGVELEKLRLENMALRERLKDFEKFREALRAIM